MRFTGVSLLSEHSVLRLSVDNDNDRVPLLPRRAARRNTDTRLKMAEVAPWWCSGVTPNLPENVFPANTRGCAALREQPVKGPGPSFGSTLLFGVFFAIDSCLRVGGYHCSNPDNILFFRMPSALITFWAKTKINGKK